MRYFLPHLKHLINHSKSLSKCDYNVQRTINNVQLKDQDQDQFTISNVQCVMCNVQLKDQDQKIIVRR